MKLESKCIPVFDSVVLQDIQDQLWEYLTNFEKTFQTIVRILISVKLLLKKFAQQNHINYLPPNIE